MNSDIAGYTGLKGAAEHRLANKMNYYHMEWKFIEDEVSFSTEEIRYRIHAIYNDYWFMNVFSRYPVLNISESEAGDFNEDYEAYERVKTLFESNGFTGAAFNEVEVL